ncbi:unnamed protein product [Knipowitschia caucasica]|uniref:Uncharacterized protein n=1 Tax=Knipowitschia caucasica TaxID=637954 RepID=A0AAV2JUT2_KNICA
METDEEEGSALSPPLRVSLKSKDFDTNFAKTPQQRPYRRRDSAERPPLPRKRSSRDEDGSSTFSGLSLDSDDQEGPDERWCRRRKSKNTPVGFFSDGKEAEPQTFDDDLDLVFKEVEERIVGCVRTELRRQRRVLATDYPECSAEERRVEREAVFSLSLHFLRHMGREDVALQLQTSTISAHSKDNLWTDFQGTLKSKLRQRFLSVFEGVAKAGSPALLNEIYTELHITEGGATDVNQEHEVRQMETSSRKQSSSETIIRCEDIFKVRDPRPQNLLRAETAEELPPIRTVLTKGVAGIGKTVLTQKFSLDWAEGRANQDVQLLLPFTFRALNVLRDQRFSLETLIQHFFGEDVERAFCISENLQNSAVVLVLDGLDECRLTLDFSRAPDLSDVSVSASVDVLLVNLIRGTLLPSARLWITTRPAAANQIPAHCVSMVTEVRGFTDEQKELYFTKRFGDEAGAVISHLRTCRSLHIMCHMPMFCWITATVLEHVLKSSPGEELPQTLTQLYVHFLVVQIKVMSVKYECGSESDLVWSQERKRMVEGLGRLAFEQLQKGNLIFYESDLKDSDINPTVASVYSGLFTQVFREEPGLYQDRVYCFVHLSVQEFMAALYVHQSFLCFGANLLRPRSNRGTLRRLTEKPKLKHLHQAAVNQALDSPNGHLDLFLRFLLGLSLPANQKLLHGLLPGQSSTSHLQDTANYINNKIQASECAERSLNLFHCLNELHERSLLQQVQQALSSGGLSRGRGLSAAQWAALVFILLSSEEQELEVFDLKKYCGTEAALLRLLPVVQASRRALLCSSSLSEHSCRALSSLLSSSASCLTHLDLSNNPLKDAGLQRLCEGLKSATCRLEQLRLSGCLISGEGCVFLASALAFNPSSLKELDLSYNHPGAQGSMFLRAMQTDPHCRLDTLRLEPGGAYFLKPGPRRYFHSLSLDPDTAHPQLQLSLHDSKATLVPSDLPYPDLQSRCERWFQVLCSRRLPERCYWEVDWSGEVYISVVYESVAREDESGDSLFGINSQSWSLSCSEGGFSVWFEESPTHLLNVGPSRSGRVGVFVDAPAGCLSFYKVCSDQLTHLYTCNAIFTEPLVLGFSLRSLDSSVTLCELPD